MRKLAPFLVLVVLIAGIGWWWQQRSVSAEPPPSNLIAALSDPASENFARATVPNNIEFPRDLGAHDDYQTEWWYYTGNLQSEDNPEREFGFQFTIFRRGLVPPDDVEVVNGDASEWRSSQLYLVHFTVSDIAGNQFFTSERYARGGADLAGAQAEPYRVWVDDWSAMAEGDGDVVRLSAESTDHLNSTPYALDLNLTQTLPPILHGEGGLSAKSLEAGNASYYYSFVQQQAVGSVRIGEETIPVTGKAWKDHEYSTSVLSEGALGWDWVSLQFDDGSALMLFQIRKPGGELEPASSGTFINPDGSTVDISVDDWSFSVDKRWKSGETGAEYPVAWQLAIPKVGLEISGAAKLEAQELTLSTGAYWEGVVGFSGTRDGNAVEANGYIEMTGYADGSAE